MALLLGACNAESGVYSVRAIQNHYPHGNENSETTLIVYESGESGHTKEILCMFPPDFQLDGNLSTPKLDEMKIPPKIQVARKLFFGACNEDYSCTYNGLTEEEPDLLRARSLIEQKALDEDNDDTAFMIYRGSDESQRHDFLDKWSLQLVYRDFDDSFYNGEETSAPELTGVNKVRVVGVGKEYATSTGYLCEKVE